MFFAQLFPLYVLKTKKAINTFTKFHIYFPTIGSIF